MKKVYSEVKKRKRGWLLCKKFWNFNRYIVENKILPFPTYIKIDVDGSEEDILKGSKKALAHNDCKSILIEVNDLISSSETEKILLECGFKCSFKNSKNKNQIWEK